MSSNYSNLGCIYPEIQLIGNEFELSKVIGRYTGEKGIREIQEAQQIPINRRFSIQKMTKTALPAELRSGLPDVKTVMPGFMGIKTDFQANPFSGKYENVRTKIFQKTNEKIKQTLQTKKSTFTNIVDIDDSEFRTYIKKNLAFKLGESGLFKGFMLFIVLMNTICLFIQTYGDYGKSYAIEVLDNVFQGIFVFEVCFKWYYGFKVYWKSSWNWLDFVLAFVPLVGASLSFVNSGKSLKIIRVFKVLRSLRSIQSFESLLRITQSIGRSVPEIVNILLLLGIVMVVFAIVGVDILNTADFHSFEIAMFSLFQVTTQDGWVKLIQMCKDNGQRTEAYIYFTLFEIIGVFILQNLIIAAIVNNTQDTFEEVKIRKQKQNKKLLSSRTQKDATFYDKSVILNKPSFSEYARVPFQIIQKNVIDSEKMDKLCLLIGILENLYCEIEKKAKALNEIHEVIKFNEMNKSASQTVASSANLEELDALTSLLKNK